MTRKSFPSQSADSRGLPPLPESFVFGVANSDHQCEAYEPGLEDIRDVWERLHGMTPRGAATDFRRRYAEDVELARQLGCKAFRFSISWSRFEPEPGQFDDEAFEFYRNLVSAIRGAGMEPIVTLHHFTWPLHIEQSGGMTARDFPALFTRYAEAVANRLGQQVRYWLTFNEPGSLVFGYIKPWWESDYFAPPGMPEGTTLDQQLRAVSKLIRNLFRAHSHARRVIRHANPDAQVGANPSLLGLPNWLQRWVNWNATHVRHRGDLEVQARRLARRPVPDSGQVDLVAAMLVPEPVGARQLMFSQAYFVGGKRLLVKMASPRSGSDDLLGGAVGVIKGSTAERSAEVLVPGTRAAIFGDLGSALSALDRGGIDAILSDDPVLRGQMARHPGRYRLLSPRVTTEPYAVAVTPGSDDLLDVVELALRRFKASGAWAASYARHLGGPAPTPPAHTLRALTSVDSGAWARGMSFPPPAVPQVPLPRAPSGTALRRIQDRGYLLAAVSQSVPGLGSCDPQSGECSGLEIDLVRAVAEQIFADPNRVRIRPAAGQATRLLRSLPGFLDPLLKSYSTLSTLIAADWWHLGMAGKLAAGLCRPAGFRRLRLLLGHAKPAAGPHPCPACVSRGSLRPGAGVASWPSRTDPLQRQVVPQPAAVDRRERLRGCR